MSEGFRWHRENNDLKATHSFACCAGSGFFCKFEFVTNFNAMGAPNRVLIITYYWPPSAGSGVQRWLKFAKYLPDFGWEPVVFTPENPDFDLKDETLLAEIPAQLEVLKFPIWEPYQLFRKVKRQEIKDTSIILEQKRKSFLDRLAIWLRANTLVPDPRVFWVRPSVKYLTDILAANDFKAVITTGPPHSMHLIGRGLKRATGIPWVADFRDPWSSWEFLDTLPMISLVRDRHNQLEHSVFREANALVTISPTFQKEMQELAQREVYLLTNGFDGSDLPMGFARAPLPSQVFEIVYTGVIDSIRNPIPFLKALKHVFEASGMPVRMTFVGRVSETVKAFVAEDGWLVQNVLFTGYVNHEVVFGYYEKAHLLLLILTDTKNARGNIPGKLFEYLATNRRILALGDPLGDSAKLIHEAEAGKVISHLAEQEIVSYLTLAQSLRNIPPPQTGLGQFERRQITQSLAEILDDL
ncbi:glycosyltransferase family 4 protein [Lunatimonas sp.]|uniref:glycosyltransferase family 4 protein n=1 Tax=Lunatimonas sp. TaxID=2060141 RepID=UPI00344F6C53